MRGTYKLNVDAAFTSGEAAAGMILRDDMGTPIHLAGYIANKSCPLHAELWTVRKGLLLLHKLGFTHVTIETDCLNVVSLLSVSLTLLGDFSLKFVIARGF